VHVLDHDKLSVQVRKVVAAMFDYPSTDSLAHVVPLRTGIIAHLP
jgi:hypothetical protein